MRTGARLHRAFAIRVAASVFYAFCLGACLGLKYGGVLLPGLVPVAFWLLGPRFHKGFPWWGRVLRVWGTLTVAIAAFVGGAALVMWWDGGDIEHMTLGELCFLMFLFFELFVAAPGVLASEAWRWLAQRRHHGQGLCRSCGYDLRGLPTRTCPECGHDQRRPEPERSWTARFERRWRMWHPLQRAASLVLTLGTAALVAAWHIRGKAWWEEPLGYLVPLAGPILAAALAIIGRDRRRRRLARLDCLVCTGCGEVVRPPDGLCPRCGAWYTHDDLRREWAAVAERTL